ncbi:hypothetical protein Leryth_026650 [Lithospermum erythrorhizon]|nr:hypothetical protein Leryth_026650 [Lithospermum erythrorhizon]
MEGLVPCDANYVPLSPISFLERASFVYGDKLSTIYGNTKYSWREMHERCIKLASALSQLGISRRDMVGAIAPNIPALNELHFVVPMVGAILSTFNTKLSPTILALHLEQLEPKLIFVDSALISLVLDSLSLISVVKSKPSIIVLLQERHAGLETLNLIKQEASLKNVLTYDSLMEMGHANFKIVHPKDENEPIAVNFTSGSTGRPKGVVYSHRAAYLSTIAQIFRFEMGKMSVFLWTVDMFRCNGWCFPWTMAASGGTNIFLRDDITGKSIMDAVFLYKVTNFCGAPIILKKIADAIDVGMDKLPHSVNIMVAGTMPPPEVQEKLEALGFRIDCGYGMTEALGIVISKPWKSPEDIDNDQGNEEEKMVSAREGIHNLMVEGVDVKDPETMESVPNDGETIGEIMVRSNTLMLGYLKNSQATQDVFEGGWYRTRDLGVRLKNGEIELKDRAIDMIKVDGKSVSTLEVEGVIIRHPMVLEAAVVGKPHINLGEVPCALLKLKEGSSVTPEEIMEFCSIHLPSHMNPYYVIFGDLPVNSTGKIQKFTLREKARALQSR